MSTDRFLDTFREEASELLGKLESLLLELDRKPGDGEILSAIFRVMHTIKGSAGMVGMNRVCALAHGIESILSALRDGTIPYTRAIADSALVARDYITDMLGDACGEAPSANDAEIEGFLSSFRTAGGYAPSPGKGPEPCTEPKAGSRANGARRAAATEKGRSTSRLSLSRTC